MRRANLPDLVSIDFFTVPRHDCDSLRSRRARSSTPEETCNANFSQFPEKALQIGIGNHVSCDAPSVVIELPYWTLHRIVDLHRASPRIISPEGAVSDRPLAGRLLSLPGAPRD